MVAENPILWLLGNLVSLYTLVVFAYLVVQLLVQFNYADRRHPITIFIMSAGQAVVEPALRPIRKMLPAMGNFDLSPLVLLLGIQFAYKIIVWVIVRAGLA